MRRFAVICGMELRFFTRDFFGFFFTLVFPVLMLLLFGGIFGNAPVYEGADRGMMDVSVPAYAVMIMGVTGLMALPLTLSSCKEKKIYKRFDATPVGKKSIILAQVLVNFVMTVTGISVLLIAGRLLYQIQVKGGFFPIGISMLLSIAAMFSMGFFFTAIGRDLKTTSLLSYCFYFIMLFLSGATMPDMLFPESLKKISALLPMTYAVDLMQGVFAGEPLRAHGSELFILGAVTAVCVAAGAALYAGNDPS